MKTLNKLIEEYTNQLRLGEIQIAYKGILEFMGKLRAAFYQKIPTLRCKKHIPRISGYILFLFKYEAIKR